MMDIYSKEIRSHNMIIFKGKDTKLEILVRKYFFSKYFRYKLHDKDLPGKPNIILPKYKTVIFVYGCFWNGMKDADFLLSLKQGLSSGLIRSIQTYRMIREYWIYLQ